MMQAILSLVPINVWKLLLKFTAVIALSYFLYEKGVMAGKDVCKEQYDKIYQEQVEKQVVELEEKIQSYILLVKAREEQKQILEVSLQKTQQENRSILKALSNAKDTTKPECSILSDERYQLYKQLYNTQP